MLCVWLPPSQESTVLGLVRRGGYTRPLRPITKLADIPSTARALLVHLDHVRTYLHAIRVLRTHQVIEPVLVVPDLLSPLDWQPVQQAVGGRVCLLEQDLKSDQQWRRLESLLGQELPGRAYLDTLRAFAQQGPLTERALLRDLVEWTWQSDSVKAFAHTQNVSPARLSQRCAAVRLSAPKVLLHALRSALLVDLHRQGLSREQSTALLHTTPVQLAATLTRTAGITTTKLYDINPELMTRWVEALLKAQVQYKSVEHAYQQLVHASIDVPSMRLVG